MKVLVVEDDPVNVRLLSRILVKQSYDVTVAGDGVDGLKEVKKSRFDALLVDWMMPKMDGIEFIRRARETLDPVPLIIMITAIDLPAARNHALNSGADVFITKPYSSVEVMQTLYDGLARLSQPAPTDLRVSALAPILPPFVGVAIATSTGGPPALIEVLRGLPASVMSKAAFFLVQHGPEWMLSTFTSRIQGDTSLEVVLGSQGMAVEPGHLYLAPGDRHLTVRPGHYTLKVSNDPPENFVRPAADPLFHSTAEAFGRYCVGVILTGMGRDGTRGAAYIHKVGGVVLAQDPGSAMAPSMPQTVIEAGLAKRTAPLSKMGSFIGREAEQLSGQLSQKLSETSKGP